ncbi:MAG: N-acetylmuramoyl-L-alanine amidase [Candidatus Omnitrophica bacterium]|nr:N-acetylmuramoyl-L-alanine amidase [Candidatus Omnitrophota bacterium]
MCNVLKRLTLYYLLSTLLCGCATVPAVSVPGLKTTVVIDGARYVSAESLCQIYNLDYHWDPVAKKATLSRDNKEVKVMAESSVVLLNNTVRAMDKEAVFYQGSLVIPHSFARRTLDPFFREEYIKRKAVPAGLGLTLRCVVIDPGHGGKDPGAIGKGGLKEKDAVLDIARRLKGKLNAAGINVVLTRESDRFLSLSQRSQIADTNLEKADFFISIHANAARSKWVKGVEVFYLSESMDDNLRSFEAAKSYDLNLDEGYSGKNTTAIIWDLRYSDDRKSANEMAGLISQSLSRKLSRKNRGAKPARFQVLKTNIPAVLVEVGFISNLREEKKLKSSSYRDRIAEGIAKGVIQYNRNYTQGRAARH